MFDYFKDYLSDTQWLIFEKGWNLKNPEMQTVSEVQLALGNGYIGSRSVLEEIPKGASPGTFFAGLYDTTGAQVTELVNAPNPIDTRMTVEGEKLDVTAMDVLRHERILDMRQGLLARHTIYANSRKKKFDYQSLRFFDMRNKHIAVMQIYVSPLDEPATFTVESSIDTGVFNKGYITEGTKKHFHIVDFSQLENIHYLCTETLEKEIKIAYASLIRLTKGKKTQNISRRKFAFHLRKGESACITKFFSFYTSREVSAKQIKSKTVGDARKASLKGFERLIKEHNNEWRKKWLSADIEIGGDPDIERVIRFNVYHLLIAGSEENLDASIGAKALTGEGYRGHIFWDTEIFVLPFFIWTNPQTAKNLLLYRYNRLSAAREIAKEKGYRGAMFSWESADTGKETTPSWYKADNGTIKKVNTGYQEHHITADIAYAVFHYFNATGDDNFLLKYGLEIILETARFWASRVIYNGRQRKYEIKHVIGPDEFHEGVNNNTYTNALAKWNLEIAAKLFNILKRGHPSEVNLLVKKIGLKQKECAIWRNIASKIFLPTNNRGIVEQFEGFFRLKKLPLPEADMNHLPIFPKKLTMEKIAKTQFIKQADVILLLYLLSDIYTFDRKRKNYLFYEKRTLHKSSLSAPVYAVAGLEAGEIHKAYRYFLTSAYTDLKNIYGNTSDGIHSATIGGTWQTVINGFAGVRIQKGVLTFDPKLPYNWNRMKFALKWKGYDISVNVAKNKLAVHFKSKNKEDQMSIRVQNIPHKIHSNKTAYFPLKPSEIAERYMEGAY